MLATLGSLGAGPALGNEEPADQPGNVVNGQKIYALCSACHGMEGAGNAQVQAPAIAGLNEWYLVAQLQNFKDGVRGTHPADIAGMMMRPMARTLKSDQDIKDVSAYLAGLPPKPPAPQLHGDLEKGKALYATCFACHGDKGQGNDTLQSPALNHLDDWYQLTQLKKYKAGIRGTHEKDLKGMQMRALAGLLADEQAMIDVVAYIVSLAEKQE